MAPGWPGSYGSCEIISRPGREIPFVGGRYGALNELLQCTLLRRYSKQQRATRMSITETSF